MWTLKLKGFDVTPLLPVVLSAAVVVIFLYSYSALIRCNKEMLVKCQLVRFAPAIEELQKRQAKVIAGQQTAGPAGEGAEGSAVTPADARTSETAPPGDVRVPDPSFKRVTTYAGHISWALSTGLFLIALGATFIVGLFVIWNGLRAAWASKAGDAAFIIFVLLVLSAAFTWYFHIKQWEQRTNLELWVQLTQGTVVEDVENAKEIFQVHTSLGLGLVLWLAFASAATVLTPRGRSTRTREEGLLIQVKSLRLILYAGTTMLIVSTLRLSTLLHWALAYLKPAGKDDPAAAFLFDGLSGAVSSTVTSMGAFYTLLIAAVYVPSALVLNARLDELAAAKPAAAKGGKEEAKAQPRLTLPISEQLLRIVAILGPLLAGQIGDLLGRLK